MVYPREVLNRLKWTGGESLDDAVIWYVHRGAPGDALRITGDKVKELGRGFFDTEDATVPYHRILKIEYRGRIVFEKKSQRKKPS